MTNNYFNYKFAIGQLVTRRGSNAIYQVDEIILSSDNKIYYGISEDESGSLLMVTEDDLKEYEGSVEDNTGENVAPRAVYLCNRKRCKNCSSTCKHTFDIEYAMNFVNIDGVGEEYWEVDPDENKGLSHDPKFSVGDKVIYDVTNEVCVILSIEVIKDGEDMQYWYYIESMDGDCAYYNPVAEYYLRAFKGIAPELINDLMSARKVLDEIRSDIMRHIDKCVK